MLPDTILSLYIVSFASPISEFVPKPERYEHLGRVQRKSRRTEANYLEMPIPVARILSRLNISVDLELEEGNRP